MARVQPSFPIPASLQDLEREPYHLFPYPHDFDDEDEAARADSFVSLVDLVERGNQSLVNGASSLFPKTHCPDQSVWMDGDRIQALYTLVRKSKSLAPATRARLIQALCHALKILSSILDDDDDDDDDEEMATYPQIRSMPVSVMSQAFRDAFACHLYMLFSVMFLMESESKISTGISAGGGRRADKSAEMEATIATRVLCAEAMLVAARSMSKNRNKMWQRGVPDETVVILPCRIAIQMLESATGILARKASSADIALEMIACTVDSGETLLGTIVAGLMDMLHSYEHMASLCVELCCMVSEKPTNRLAIELIREIGRLDASSQTGSDAGKVSGIRNVAPFLSELAVKRPRLVLANISHILPHLDSEPYCLRSAIVTALGHIVEHIGKSPVSSGDQMIQTLQQQECESESSRLHLEKSRNNLLDILQQRSHDVSSYTRSAVLKSWISLTQCGTLPLERVISATAMAIDRLQDKAVIVRKVAMQLLTTLLENNPFMGDLNPEPYRAKLHELYDHVKYNMPDNIKEAHEAALADAKQNNDGTEAILHLERAALAAAISEADSMDDLEGMSDSQRMFKAKVEALKFAQAALDFINQFENASASFHSLLLSASTSDVTEALRFFVKARHFNLPCAVTGMKQSLSLMWSSEQSIKDEVLKAFVDVFIAVPGTDGADTLPDDQIAYNLLTLADQASASELASMEEAISHLVREERIPADVFSILWSATAKGSGDSRATAIQLLSMGATADRNIVDSKSRLKLLLDVGLGDYTEEHKDWKTVRAVAVALQRIERAQVDPTCAKHLVLERIMEQLCIIARGDWCDDTREKGTLEWLSAAEQAIGALLVISPEPEVACSEIVRGMHLQTLGASCLEKCHHLRLSRFFFVIGHIALKLLVYTEALSSGVRRANAKKTLKKQEEADKAKSKGCSEMKEENDDIEAELGMAAEVEAENERKVAEIAEKEIVGRGLLSMFGPLIVRVVANEGGRFNSEVLMQTATLALCKFMCVSSAFCEKHLPVLFTALVNSPDKDTTMRANTVVALGDLAFRFPNEFEPYTPRLYACLRDNSTKVRRHTLMVLTHLILNDMVKIKGQVCEIALCLRDEDQRIRDMSRLLFHELSKRSNSPVYNLLPDIISQLGQMSLSKEDYRGIMFFLLNYIKKERQHEMLIEKLCQRFPKCNSIAQKADIAYSMAQLKLNQRSLKYLVDNFKLYKDALYDEDVKRCFFSMATKAKKFSKAEAKEILDEWEAKLTEQAEIGTENQLAGEKAALAKATASKRSARSARKAVDNDQGRNDEEDILGADTLSDFDGKENIQSGPSPNIRRTHRKVGVS